MTSFNEIQSQIKNLLLQKIGLNPDLIDFQFLSSVIHQRMTALGLQQLRDYWVHLQASSLEFEAFLDLILVPETWFFRNPESFTFLQAYICSEWQIQRSSQSLRVLSVPCSTGEEPYSIAIALIEAGLTAKNFKIDAVDISQKNLTKAKRGVYKTYSFRGQSFLKELSPYFAERQGEFYLQDWIKQTVHFRAGNILEPLFLASELPYDIIFCRNLLIYFDTHPRLQTLSRLNHLLKPGGLLFVGCAETSQISNPQFIAIHSPAVFAFQKHKSVPLPMPVQAPKEKVSKVVNHTSLKSNLSEHQQTLQKIEILPQSQTTSSKINSTISPVSDRTPQASVEPISQTPSILDNARKLANCGKLQEAATLCETYLSQNITNPHAYLLLGEVHQAAGRAQQALECFQKAIYLDPNYYEALVHLALLKEQQGDRAGAAILYQRIQRIRNQ
jgi:chemotaxis protein methyltransferase WspC